jgi:CheY-like chemotaxis protein
MVRPMGDAGTVDARMAGDAPDAPIDADLSVSSTATTFGVSARSPRTARKSILVVEDEPEIQAILSTVFDEEGYLTRRADDGEAAVQLARSERPALITLDLMLPKKSGHEVLEELASDPATSAIPVVVVSAYTSELTWTPQVKAVVPKPFDLGHLLDLAAQIIGDPQ